MADGIVYRVDVGHERSAIQQEDRRTFSHTG